MYMIILYLWILTVMDNNVDINETRPTQLPLKDPLKITEVCGFINPYVMCLSITNA